jgi:hypothetical protein
MEVAMLRRGKRSPPREEPVVRLDVAERRRAEQVQRRLEDVRRRLESGELDSELALVETALALLDGDLPGV